MSKPLDELTKNWTPERLERVEAMTQAMINAENDPTSLNYMEPHPSAFIARQILEKKMAEGLDLFVWQESFSSCAIEGNRLGEICSGTLNRLMTGQPVSDRYLMGLVFAIIAEDYLKE